jgi:hypothetical protein
MLLLSKYCGGGAKWHATTVSQIKSRRLNRRRDSDLGDLDGEHAKLDRRDTDAARHGMPLPSHLSVLIKKQSRRIIGGSASVSRLEEISSAMGASCFS